MNSSEQSFNITSGNDYILYWVGENHVEAVEFVDEVDGGWKFLLEYGREIRWTRPSGEQYFTYEDALLAKERIEKHVPDSFVVLNENDRSKNLNLHQLYAGREFSVSYYYDRTQPNDAPCNGFYEERGKKYKIEIQFLSKEAKRIITIGERTNWDEPSSELLTESSYKKIRERLDLIASKTRDYKVEIKELN